MLCHVNIDISMIFFFFNDTATTHIYTLSLHDALPISLAQDEKATLKWYAIKLGPGKFGIFDTFANEAGRNTHLTGERSEEHTSELQSRQYLVCRLLLEKKKKKSNIYKSLIKRFTTKHS